MAVRIHLIIKLVAELGEIHFLLLLTQYQLEIGHWLDFLIPKLYKEYNYYIFLTFFIRLRLTVPTLEKEIKIS
jgi:hypothetical protein